MTSNYCFNSFQVRVGIANIAQNTILVWVEQYSLGVIKDVTWANGSHAEGK